MQILIDIPNNEYERIVKDPYYENIYGKSICKIIKKGIPLPKKHGDLIDRDELKRYAGWYNLATDKSIHAVLTKEIDWVKPVIERTKEGDNE